MSASAGRDVVRRDKIFTGTREDWRQKIVEFWRPYLSRLGHDLPARIWISVGRPPSSRWTGVCYPDEASDDCNPQIFVNPVISDSTRAAGVVVHQLCHAALGHRRHGADFRALAIATGLVGKMTATIEGPLFQQLMPTIIDRYGPYPHSALRQLRGLDRKPPGSRLIRARSDRPRSKQSELCRSPRGSPAHCVGDGNNHVGVRFNDPASEIDIAFGPTLDGIAIDGKVLSFDVAPAASAPSAPAPAASVRARAEPLGSRGRRRSRRSRRA
jgi:hypothetical protein